MTHILDNLWGLNFAVFVASSQSDSHKFISSSHDVVAYVVIKKEKVCYKWYGNY